MKNFIKYIVFLILLLLTACGNKQDAPNIDSLENNSIVIDCGNEDSNVPKDADVCIEREESHASNIVSYFVEERSNEAYEYDAYSDHIVITGITQIEPDGKLSIPSEIDGLPVTAIGNRKYSRIDHEPSISPEDLETLIIPDTVTCLGDFVFGHCYKLQSVSIPESVSEIGFGVFYRTPWLEAQTSEFVVVGDGILLKYNGDDSTVHIPTTVKYISGAFYEEEIVNDAWNENLNQTMTEAFIPDSVKILGTGAFAGCASLQKVHFSDSLQKIGTAAFAECTSLVSIHLPDTLEEIGTEAFAHCSTLEYVDVPLSVKVIGSEAFGGTPFRADCTDEYQIVGDGIMISYNGNDVDIVIPDGVKSIACGYSGLSGRKLIHFIVIPDTVTYIGDEAFSECRNLHRISIPSHLEYVGEMAFDWCDKLEPLILPDSVEYIGRFAFHKCDAIRSFRIPEQLREIKSGTFAGCKKLSIISIPSSVISIAEDAFDECDIFMYCCKEGTLGYDYATEKANYPSPQIAQRQADGTYLNEFMHQGILYYTTYNEMLLEIEMECYEAELAENDYIKGSLYSRELYTYDRYGNVLTDKSYDSNQKMVKSMESQYNDDGQLMRSATYDENSALVEYSIFSYNEDEVLTDKQTFDQNDILIAEMFYTEKGVWKKSCRYDSSGNLIEMREVTRMYDRDFIYTYDGNMNLIETQPFG